MSGRHSGPHSPLLPKERRAPPRERPDLPLAPAAPGGRRHADAAGRPAAAALADKLRLTFPVGHSADADAVAEQLGAYVNDEPRHLQSTGFVLAPDGSVVTALYSSGAIGRLLPDDVVGLVTYVQQHS